MLTESQWQHFQYFSKEPHRLIEKIRGEVLLGELPKVCFAGTQKLSEYSRKKERRVKRLFKKEGKKTLDNWPVISCALPIIDKKGMFIPDFFDNPAGTYQLVLLDGHHRVRYAPIFDIYNIPTVILTLSQTAEAYKVETLDRMATILETWMQESLGSFSKKMPNLLLPQPITFSRSPNGLIPVRK
jgi:hypothetical protein